MKSLSPRVRAYLLLCIVLAGTVFIFRPIFHRASDLKNNATCFSHQKQIAFACRLYMEDSDDKFPPLSVDKNGWADLLQPYAENWVIFECPTGEKSAQTRRTDYFYNAHLANQKYPKFPATTILFGEGVDNSGTNAHLLELPLDWYAEENLAAPAFRHFGGANYVFADGHAERLKPKQITLDRPNLQHVTFLIR